MVVEHNFLAIAILIVSRRVAHELLLWVLWRVGVALEIWQVGLRVDSWLLSIHRWRNPAIRCLHVVLSFEFHSVVRIISRWLHRSLDLIK